MIKCNKCNKEQQESEFYPRNRVCKTCTKARVKERAVRADVIDSVRASKRKYANSEKGRESAKRCGDRYYKNPKNRKKVNAKESVRRAVKSGKITKSNCEICGCEKALAHHDDYNKPLDVRWLCTIHHNEWHGINGEGKNAN